MAASTVTPAAAAPPPPLPPAAAWVVVDAGTGRVLAARNDRQPLPPASLTKVLTALVAAGWLPADASVPVSAVDATVYPDRVGMKAGQVWPLPIAIRALLIFSANDAAYAIAERVAGSVGRFGAVMDAAGRELGMADHPVLHDPAGLDGSEGVGGGNLISARDLAIASRALLAEPDLAQIVALQHFAFQGPDHVGYDIWSKDLAFLRSQPGAIGIKTGFTDRAGSCLIGAATQGGRTLIAVILNGANPTLTARMLLAHAFATPASAEPRADALPPVVIPRLGLVPPGSASAEAGGRGGRAGAGKPGLARSAAGAKGATAKGATGDPPAHRQAAAITPAGSGNPSRSWPAVAAAGAVMVVTGGLALVAAGRRR